ncbi:MAG: hypothetical protein R3275_03190 [Saprospiraceae bacterium]|nr:hypothetical protein [Saprospiraceae bacterium]
MANESIENLKQKMQERLDQLKGSMENLNKQLQAGAAEAKDEFQKQKERIGEWSREMSHKVENMKEISDEKTQQIKASLEDLRVQAALGKAESRDAIQEQQKKLTSAIGQLKKRMSDLYESAGENVKDFADRAEHTLEDYHTRLDMLKLKAHLGREDMEQAWEERKKEVSKRIQDISHKIDRQKEKSGENWNHFSSEMKEAWQHLRKAFSV